MAARKKAAPEAVEPVEGVAATEESAEAVADLEDAPADPEAVSAAPPRTHGSLVAHLGLKWEEVKTFSDHLTGDLDGELGEVLALARKYKG